MAEAIFDLGVRALAMSARALKALNEAAEMGDVTQAEKIFAAPQLLKSSVWVGSGGLPEGGQAADDGVQHAAEGWEKGSGAAWPRPMRTGARRRKRQLGSARWSHGEFAGMARRQGDGMKR